MASEVRRVRVCQYEKSKKLVAILSDGRHSGYIVLDLSPDMTSIVEVRNPSYLRAALFNSTPYQAEVEVNSNTGDKGRTLFSFKLIRVVTSKDIEPNRWLSTKHLEDLPVSPHEQATPEELLWAGARKGNLGGGIALAIITALFFIGPLASFLSTSDRSTLGWCVVSVISGVFLAKYRWVRPRKPNPTRLTQLADYKEALRARRTASKQAAITAFDKALKDYSNWHYLTPDRFELAIKRLLEKEGYTVKMTRYSRDGGIDLEGFDPEGRSVIVQAKKYKKPVGIKVVREMIGVRTARTDNPRTIVFSLVGYTRDAKHFAEQNGIELRAVRGELLKV